MRWSEADLAARGYVVPLAQDTPEGTLLARIRRIAKEQGYLTYHVYDSRKSELGYPDLTMVKPGHEGRPGRLIYAELKSQRGKLTIEQQTWLDILRQSLPGIEVYCWRPSDFEEIVQILTRK